MKRLIFTIILCTVAFGVFAQNSTDYVKSTPDSAQHKKGLHITFGHGEGASQLNVNKTPDTVIREHSKSPGFSWGLTFSRFDLGLTTLIDNGSFTLQPQNQFLRYRSWKSSNVGFDLIQAGYRFSSSFKIYASAGFDWTLLRLRENVTITEHAPVLSYTESNIDFTKNRFSADYLRLPLSFEFRTKDNDNGDRWHFVFGPEGGILLGGMVKQKSDELGKQKQHSDYHFTKFRYGPFLRVGYGGWGIFAKYYMNDMFQNSPEQKGLKNFSFGFTFGF